MGFGKRVCRSGKAGWVLVVPLSPTLSCIPMSVLKDASTSEGVGFGMLLKKSKGSVSEGIRSVCLEPDFFLLGEFVWRSFLSAFT